MRRAALKATREEPAALRDRRARAETLLGGRDSKAVTQAEAAARSAATLAVSRDIGSLRERLAAVEMRAGGGRLPPPPQSEERHADGVPVGDRAMGSRPTVPAQRSGKVSGPSTTGR